MTDQLDKQVPLGEQETVENEPVESRRMTSQERHKQIVQAAIRLFSQKGFRGTTTKEIALAAKVNEAIIFRHFATKDDLYAAILDYKTSVYTANLEQKPGEGSQALMFKMLGEFAAKRDDEGLFHMLATTVIACNREANEFVRLMLYSALEGHELAEMVRSRQVNPIEAFLKDYVESRQSEGAFKSVNSSAAVRAFMGMVMNHVIVTQVFKITTYQVSDEEAVETFTRIFLSGLRREDKPNGD